MKSQIATTIEQSKRLLSCGVDPKTADLFWLDDGNNRSRLTIYRPIISNRYKVVEAWSLSRILELLPKSIMSQYGNEYFFELSRLRMHDQWEAQWVIHGERFKTVNKADKSFCKLWDKSPIEACVKAIEWVVNNGYSLNKIEE